MRTNVNDYIAMLLKFPLILVLIGGLIFSPCEGLAQSPVATGLNLPVPGTMIQVTPVFTPPRMCGINIYPDNSLKFDFIFEQGDLSAGGDFNQISLKLIKYFLAALTVPQDDLWVNLSPYEKNRIIPEGFGQTEMGRDLLVQDYLLKQLMASMMFPEDELGRKFWNRVYKKAYEKFGTTEIPVDTFNKIWIIPESAKIYEHSRGALIVDSHLKVMLEKDYLAEKAARGKIQDEERNRIKKESSAVAGLTADVIRDILIPEIEKEINEGTTFANLRQVYCSVILASWYKEKFQESFLQQTYFDQNKTKGVDVEDKNINLEIYTQYLAAFKKGVFDLIKEDYDPVSRETIPRKYFSGGITLPGKRQRVSGFNQSMKDMKVVTVKMEKIDDQAMAGADILKWLEEMKSFRGGGRLPLSRLLQDYPEQMKTFVQDKNAIFPPSLLYIEVQPTDHCQLNCKFCRGGLRRVPEKSSWVSKEALIKFLQSVPSSINQDDVKIRFSGSTGEPLFHPSIVDFFQIVNARGWHLGLVTNGLFLNNQKRPGLFQELVKAEFINISLDAGTENTYISLKGGSEGDLDKVIKNISDFIVFRNKQDGKTRVVISFLLQKENQNEIEAIIQHARKAGVDAVEFKVQHYDERRIMTQDSIKYIFREIARVKTQYESDTFHINILQGLDESLQKVSLSQEINFPTCFVSKLGLSLTIDPKGNIQSCCQYHAKTLGVQGNIEQEDFMTFWNGSRRKEILSQDPGIFCKGNSCAPSHFIQNHVLTSLQEGMESGLNVDEYLNKVDEGKKGGIDLNLEDLKLQIERDHQGSVMALSHQPVVDGKIEGFLPVIVKVAVAVNVESILELSSQQNQKKKNDEKELVITFDSKKQDEDHGVQQVSSLP